MKHFERRMAVQAVEFRDGGDNAPTLTGYASTFNQPYDMGWYRETVAPGAFTRSLGRNPDVRLLVNHDGLPLARTTSGTLTLDEDRQGLRVSAQLDPSDPDVAALVPKMRRGDLNQMSFGFRVMGDDGDEWSKDLSSRTLRTLDIHDGDVSVVTYPANPGTSAGVRGQGTALDAMASALRTLEQRGASPDDVVAVLTRALGYFRSDPAALEEPTPDPDDDEPTEGESDESAREAQIARESRQRVLRLLG